MDSYAENLKRKQRLEFFRRVSEARQKAVIDTSEPMTSKLHSTFRASIRTKQTKYRETRIKLENMKLLNRLRKINARPTSKGNIGILHSSSYMASRKMKMERINWENQRMHNRLQKTGPAIDSWFICNGVGPKNSSLVKEAVKNKNSRKSSSASRRPSSAGVTKPRRSPLKRRGGSTSVAAKTRGRTKASSYVSVRMVPVPEYELLTIRRHLLIQALLPSFCHSSHINKQKGKELYSELLKIGSYLIKLCVSEVNTANRHFLRILATKEDLVLKILSYLDIARDRTRGIRVFLKQVFVEEAKTMSPPTVEWTAEETETLIRGVRKHDARWRAVLSDPGFHFHPSRTRTDLSNNHSKRSMDIIWGQRCCVFLHFKLPPPFEPPLIGKRWNVLLKLFQAQKKEKEEAAAAAQIREEQQKGANESDGARLNEEKTVVVPNLPSSSIQAAAAATSGHLAVGYDGTKTARRSTAGARLLSQSARVKASAVGTTDSARKLADSGVQSSRARPQYETGPDSLLDTAKGETKKRRGAEDTGEMKKIMGMIKVLSSDTAAKAGSTIAGEGTPEKDSGRVKVAAEHERVLEGVEIDTCPETLGAEPLCETGSDGRCLKCGGIRTRHSEDAEKGDDVAADMCPINLGVKNENAISSIIGTMAGLDLVPEATTVNDSSASQQDGGRLQVEKKLDVSESMDDYDDDDDYNDDDDEFDEKALSAAKNTNVGSSARGKNGEGSGAKLSVDGIGFDHSVNYEFEDESSLMVSDDEGGGVRGARNFSPTTSHAGRVLEESFGVN
eukprot:jgi/Bigna1/86064/estExt_fgenesh1_pg.C_70365